MRRWLSIALMLLVWSAQGGLVQFLHERDAAAHPAGHDESKCHICATVHAPVVGAPAPAIDLGTSSDCGLATVVPVEVLPPPACLIHPSRGPPLA